MIKWTSPAFPAVCVLAMTLQACGGGGGPGITPHHPNGSDLRMRSFSIPTVTNEYAVPSPNSLPWDIAAGPDGALWFAERSAGRLGRITTGGAIREFVITGPARFQFAVANGPDENLWTTGISVPNPTVQERSNNPSPNNAVFRVTTGGLATQFRLPADSFPKQIVAGPDGNLWFVERYGKIGRISTSGNLTEFPIPNSPSGPSGITVGPDNALWFTATFGGYVGRVTTSGDFSEFPLPNGGGPFGIATGADGNLWIAEFFGDAIARMTPTGTVTEFALASGSSPRAIVAAPNGKLYFTENGSGKIGEITVMGSVTEFNVPTANSQPTGIAVGSDGNVWFTEANGNKVGKISL